jgi:hypothetical protein
MMILASFRFEKKLPFSPGFARVNSQIMATDDAPERRLRPAAANPLQPAAKPRYTWPWFVLSAVLLAILLAILWMSKEVERMRRIRDANAPPAQTNSAETESGAKADKK